MAKVSIFARRLKQARLSAGLSQRQLGINAGIDPFSASSRMNQYERGKSWPHLKIITRIASALSVPLPWLFCDDEHLAILILKFPALSKAWSKTLSKGQIKGLLAKLPET